MDKLKEGMIKHGFAPQVRRATSDDMRKMMTGERFTDDSVPFEDTFAGRYYAAQQSPVVKEALAGMASDRARVRVLVSFCGLLLTACTMLTNTSCSCSECVPLLVSGCGHLLAAVQDALRPHLPPV